ncbi:hypothetical protein [Halopiger djelfimassiliensis]|uniref:hypothetical protein n=1 Tax=Halopiger djelfimassiliensis TaxID=1293047 RepID=UPI0006779172|nr:hypothetical protein [Halopiger djelfimassiliensis]
MIAEITTATRAVGTLVAVVVLCGTLVAGLAAPAFAADQVAIVSPDSEHVEVAPGDSFELDVDLRSQGGHGDDGVAGVTIVSQYHPDYLEVTDIERGPWLEGGNETEIHTATAIANDEGTAILEQWREPVAGGATGIDTVATVTVEVDEDASPAATEITFGESDVDLESEWPLPVVDERTTTVTIDGGEESPEPFDHPDPDEFDPARDSDSDESGSDDDAAEGESPTDESDSVPGFTPGAVLLAGGLALAGAGYVTLRQRSD